MTSLIVVIMLILAGYFLPSIIVFFKKRKCQNPNFPFEFIFRLDTRLLDSLLDMGING